MNRFAMSNVALLMSYKISPKEIEKIIDRLDIVPSDDTVIADSQEGRVAAIQLLIKRYSSLADYIVDMNLYVADAVNRRARLVCFPEFAGLLPASFLPGYEAALENLRPQGKLGLPDISKLGETLSYFSDCIFDAYFHTMSMLAARHGVWIMAGSSLYFDGGDLCHRAFLFSDTGELAGVQDKISLTPLEQELHLEPASEVKVFESPVGPVAMLTGSDAQYYEIARVARNLGARVLLHPAAMIGEYTPVRTTLGLNMRVQENNVWGMQSVLVGDTGLGFATEGACCTFGPVNLTRSRNGVVNRSSGRLEPDILCTNLNLELLSKTYSPYRKDRNVEFLQKYMDRLY